MFKKNANYFHAVRISISLAILSEIFIQIGCITYLQCDDAFCTIEAEALYNLAKLPWQ